MIRYGFPTRHALTPIVALFALVLAGCSAGPMRMYVNPHAKFDSCVSIGTNTWDLVNAARADLGTNMQNTHTVNLNP